MGDGDGLWPVILCVLVFVITATPATFASDYYSAWRDSGSSDPACGSYVLVIYTKIPSTAAPAPSADCSLGPGHCAQQDRAEQ